MFYVDRLQDKFPNEEFRQLSNHRVDVESARYYIVSNMGRVFSLHTMRMLMVWFNTEMIADHLAYGDVQIFNTTAKKSKGVKLHRIVASTFLGDKPNMQVDHRNGCRGDNRLENLEYVTRKENQRRAVAANHYGNPRTSRQVDIPDISNAEWKEIGTHEGDNFNDYEIGSTGAVRYSLLNGVGQQTVSMHLSDRGDIHINVTTDNGVKKHRSVARLVAFYFRREEYDALREAGHTDLVVFHLDSDRHNNNYENLQWMTRSELVNATQAVPTTAIDMSTGVVQQFPSQHAAANTYGQSKIRNPAFLAGEPFTTTINVSSEETLRILFQKTEFFNPSLYEDLMMYNEDDE